MHQVLLLLFLLSICLQAVSSMIWRPLKAHRWRGAWDVGHHWLGRAAVVLAIAAMFTGIYIAAVGWGYYVAYGAALAVFLLLMAFKDIIDIFMVWVLSCMCLVWVILLGLIDVLAQCVMCNTFVVGMLVCTFTVWCIACDEAILYACLQHFMSIGNRDM